MYPRDLELPGRSFFLFGPRSTGKTTWLRSVLGGEKSCWFDLVLDSELVRLSREPELFTQEVEALPRGSWIVLDEVQRLPMLLGRVHDLIARHGPGRYRFALTGSSARKLKRGGADLLPGRVVNRLFFPLTASELGEDFDLSEVLRFGSLPSVCAAEKRSDRIGLLEVYAQNYLTQEVRAEALVKDLVPFARFLDVAALANAQVTNVSSLARDAGVARPTVQGYFEVLVDTLIGTWLAPWSSRVRVKEVGHPKFYFFDSGVVRALTRRLHDAPSEGELGSLLETYVLHELRAWMNVSQCGGTLSYWRTPSGSEVDFVWSRGRRAVGIEVKTGRRWRREDGRTLATLVDECVLEKGYGVYRGDRPLRAAGIEVLPVGQFLRDLARGEVIG